MIVIDKIKNLITEPNSNVADILRLCLILGSELSSPELTNWAKSELNGYNETSTTPTYRILESQGIKGHFFGAFGREIRNAEIPFTAIPERYRDKWNTVNLREPIATYISLLDANSGTLNVPIPIQFSVKWFSEIYNGMQCVQSWLTLGSSQLEGFLDQIKTRVLEFVLEIESNIKQSTDFIKNKSEIQNIFVTNIYGGSIGNIGLTSSMHIEVFENDFESLRKQLEKWGINNTEELQKSIEKDGGKEIGSTTRRWLDYAKPITQGITGDMITKAILLYLGIS